MDRELETYVENVMEKQQYRNGIFTGWLQQILRGIADYRGVVDVRGSYGMRRSEEMETNLDQYVNKIMDEQIHRDGIELFPNWFAKLFGRK